MDWQKASAELARKLDPSHVKERKQGGSQVSYVEAWHAIAEANRIFGFDAWTRETVELRCVMEKERTIGKPPYEKPGWGVSYVARVRVTVGGVVREGSGAGHGIDVDLGAAHESALKEAESDAMKRALMTFGNPFGLALYDKSRENVGVEEPPPPSPEERAGKAHAWVLAKLATVTDVDAYDALVRSDAYAKAKNVLAGNPRLLADALNASAKRFADLTGSTVTVPMPPLMQEAMDEAELPGAFQ